MSSLQQLGSVFDTVIWFIQYVTLSLIHDTDYKLSEGQIQGDYLTSFWHILGTQHWNGGEGQPHPFCVIVLFTNISLFPSQISTETIYVKLLEYNLDIMLTQQMILYPLF